MKRNLMLIVLALGLMGACSNGKNQAVEEEPVILPIAVELTVPETAAVDETLNLETVVTQGEEKVEDASQVEFEIWEEGKKSESWMMDSENEKDGLYTGEISFDHDGLFHIQVHVTARGMHTMPTRTVTVGDGGNYEEDEEEESHDHDDHHHADGFSMHFVEPNDVVQGQEIDLITHLDMDGSPLEKARVRYEIWSERNPDNRDWVETEESPIGEYKAPHAFTEAGKFHMVIHVEDEADLHEHEEFEIEVK